ncbi:MAG: fluoride efflux transporter CrcB [Betaproteobacteria bacterium]|nr:fluoride efflux transporter CrcB [Betaproteobacteria bacterium]
MTIGYGIDALAVGVGGALGAWLRWGLSVALNASLPRLPLGTLTANLLGGFMMGILSEGLMLHWVPESLRLLLLTGFLGGLTTFSTFSAEVVNSFRHGRSGSAILEILLHTGGSLGLTWCGVVMTRALLG